MSSCLRQDSLWACTMGKPSAWASLLMVTGAEDSCERKDEEINTIVGHCDQVFKAKKLRSNV